MAVHATIFFKAFQFTPLREGRLCRGLYFLYRPPISIHAPPRGATPQERGVHHQRRISIHAPPRGATRWARRSIPWTLYFNSRPSARGDKIEDAAITNAKIISIHAPPRGATFGTFPLVCPKRFQFTPLREGRLPPTALIWQCRHISIHAPPRGATPHHIRRAGYDKFQFTPLREGRRNSFTTTITPYYFNSRPSARGDLFCWDVVYHAELISIHAPPRGAT